MSRSVTARLPEIRHGLGNAALCFHARSSLSMPRTKTASGAKPVHVHRTLMFPWTAYPLSFFRAFCMKGWSHEGNQLCVAPRHYNGKCRPMRQQRPDQIMSSGCSMWRFAVQQQILRGTPTLRKHGGPNPAMLLGMFPRSFV